MLMWLEFKLCLERKQCFDLYIALEFIEVLEQKSFLDIA